MRKRKNIIVYLLLVFSVFLITGCTAKEKSTEITIADLTISVPGEWTIEADKSDIGVSECYINKEETSILQVSNHAAEVEQTGAVRKFFLNALNEQGYTTGRLEVDSVSYADYAIINQGDTYMLQMFTGKGIDSYIVTLIDKFKSEQDAIDYCEKILKTAKIK